MKTAEETINDIYEAYQKVKLCKDYQLKMQCLDYARSIRVYDNNGETKLTADDILDAAKKFYEFVK